MRWKMVASYKKLFKRRIGRERKSKELAAKAGIVICFPAGNPNKTGSGFGEDSTRLPAYDDGTYHYLKSWGIKEI